MITTVTGLVSNSFMDDREASDWLTTLASAGFIKALPYPLDIETSYQFDDVWLDVMLFKPTIVCHHWQ